MEIKLINDTNYLSLRLKQLYFYNAIINNYVPEMIDVL